LDFAFFTPLCSCFRTLPFVDNTMLPTTLISGTIAYLVLGAILIGGSFVMRAIGMMNKDNAR
jgi:hypothetical protein